MTEYVVGATLARTGDAGAGVGIVLLAAAGPGVRTGGLLVAALTLPHLLGGRIGRLVDRARDVRRPLALGCAGYAVALALAAITLRAGAPWVAGSALLAAGACGPSLTGGLSSVTSGLGAAPERTRGLDVISYGVAGSAGPGAVAALAAATSPLTSLLVLSGAMLVAAGSIRFRLPARGPVPVPSRCPAARSVLLRERPLRRVTITTVTAAATGGMLAVLAVVLAEQATGRASDGPWLVATLGLGTLAGSALVALRPTRGEPARIALVLVAVLGVGYALVAAAPGFPLLLAAFALVGLLTAPWVTATLAARERYAPAGRQAEVFAGMAGWKIAAASGGSALAGLLSGLPPRLLIAVAGALVVTSALVMGLGDRSPAAPRPHPIRRSG